MYWDFPHAMSNTLDQGLLETVKLANDEHLRSNKNVMEESESKLNSSFGILRKMSSSCM